MGSRTWFRILVVVSTAIATTALSAAPSGAAVARCLGHRATIEGTALADVLRAPLMRM